MSDVLESHFGNTDDAWRYAIECDWHRLCRFEPQPTLPGFWLASLDYPPGEEVRILPSDVVVNILNEALARKLRVLAWEIETGQFLTLIPKDTDNGKT